MTKGSTKAVTDSSSSSKKANTWKEGKPSMRHFWSDMEHYQRGQDLHFTAHTPFDWAKALISQIDFNAFRSYLKKRNTSEYSLTNEITAASSKILTRRSSNCSRMSCQRGFCSSAGNSERKKWTPLMFPSTIWRCFRMQSPTYRWVHTCPCCSGPVTCWVPLRGSHWNGCSIPATFSWSRPPLWGNDRPKSSTFKRVWTVRSDARWRPPNNLSYKDEPLGTVWVPEKKTQKCYCIIPRSYSTSAWSGWVGRDSDSFQSDPIRGNRVETQNNRGGF